MPALAGAASTPPPARPPAPRPAGCAQLPHLLVGRSSRGARPAAATYLGAGAAAAVRQQLLLLGSTPGEAPVQAVFVNASLSAVQERNLSAQLGLPVLDRPRLIIRIFAQRARSREARLQVGAGGL
jgi:50S ribosomal subunit-associated GTPase HflX